MILRKLLKFMIKQKINKMNKRKLKPRRLQILNQSNRQRLRNQSLRVIQTRRKLLPHRQCLPFQIHNRRKKMIIISKHSNQKKLSQDQMVRELKLSQQRRLLTLPNQYRFHLKMFKIRFPKKRRKMRKRYKKKKRRRMIRKRKKIKRKLKKTKRRLRK